MGRVVLIAAAAAVAVAVTGVFVVRAENQDAPVEAVRAYVEAIARGDGAAANAVDPRSFATDADPDVAAAALASATERIAITDVALDRFADTDADTIDVRVEYRLAGIPNSVILRVVRADPGLVDTWRVLDPFLIPVRFQSTVPALDTATLGTASVPVGGLLTEGHPERRVHLYPGVYPVTAKESPYLRPTRITPLHADTRNYGQRPADEPLNTVDAVIDYEATPALINLVTERLAKHIPACFAKAPAVPSGCPEEVRTHAARTPRLSHLPALESITEYQTRNGDAKPPLRFIATDGRMTYKADDGDRSDSFHVYGHIAVNGEGEPTITFTEEL